MPKDNTNPVCIRLYNDSVRCVTLTFWDCDQCEGAFAMALGEVPLACPRCGVVYKMLFIAGAYVDPVEFVVHDWARRADSSTGPLA